MRASTARPASAPIDRFDRGKAEDLRPIDRPGFNPIRSANRRGVSDGYVLIDTHAYSVPIRFIGENVEVRIAHDRVEVWWGDTRIADHPCSHVRYGRTVVREHLNGIARKPSTPVLTSKLQVAVVQHHVQPSLTQEAAPEAALGQRRSVAHGDFVDAHRRQPIDAVVAGPGGSDVAQRLRCHVPGPVEVQTG